VFVKALVLTPCNGKVRAKGRVFRMRVPALVEVGRGRSRDYCEVLDKR